MKKRGGIHVGVSSLLLIFLVLALVSFAVLSLAGAVSDLTLSRRYAERTLGYYNACMQAQDFIAEADRAAASNADGASSAAGETHTADFPVSDTQYLHVELTVTAGLSPVSHASGDTGTVPSVTVTSWRLVTDEDALALDESLPVMP